MADLAPLLKALNDFGVLAILVLIIVTGVRRYWVFGWQYEEKLRECEDLRRLAYRLLGVSEGTIDLVRRSAPPGAQGRDDTP